MTAILIGTAIVTTFAVAFVLGRASVILSARRRAQLEAVRARGFVDGQLARGPVDVNPPTWRG